METNQKSYHVAAKLLYEADALLIGAGAGMGVDSGLPDFRGNDGFWNAYPPFKRLGLSFADLAQPGWFRSDPALAWGFYGHRLALYRSTSPHNGFAILNRWAHTKLNRVFALTSNVDGHFQMAGFPADRILECHGSIHHLQCSLPCSEHIWTADDAQIYVDAETFRARPPFPTCPHCGSIARPNILMFGDGGWIESRSYEQENRYADWVAEQRGLSVAIFECGAGAAIPTVRHAMESAARTFNAAVIRINLRDCYGGPNVVCIGEGARPALEAIDGALNYGI